MAHVQTQNQCYSSKLNPLLFPMRIVTSESDTSDVVVHDGILSEREYHGKPNHTSEITWVGASPLEWIENITCMADTSLSLNENEERFKSLTIVTDSISSSHEIPPPPPGIQRNNRKKNNDLSSTSIVNLKMCMSEGRDDDQLHLASDTDEGNTVNKKRARDSWDRDSDIDSEIVIKHDDLLSPSTWDVAIAYTSESLLPCDTLDKLQLLASRVEALSVFDLISTSYKRIRGHYGQSSESISYNSSIDIEMKRELLNNLYLNTVQKLEALLSMARNIEMEKITTSGVTYPIKTPKGSRNKASGNDSNSKKYFGQFMNRWLIDNWTNPYPDDEVMNEIAVACDTSTEIVSNWLINARTRKWRPAIVKAYELGRQADCLLEDSIHIFEGKPIREILSSPNLSAHHV